MTTNTEFQLVLCTCPDQESARHIAERLVKERLAACVSLLPGLTSVYRWQGALQCEAEVLLLIKTVAGQFAPLTETLREMHPYEVPEIIALPIAAGLADYLTWVRTCTQSDA